MKAQSVTFIHGADGSGRMDTRAEIIRGTTCRRYFLRRKNFLRLLRSLAVLKFRNVAEQPFGGDVISIYMAPHGYAQDRKLTALEASWIDMLMGSYRD